MSFSTTNTTSNGGGGGLGLGRRAFIVDGTPMDHWSSKNFQPTRDESCRVVYKPKEGNSFFQKHLQPEDYRVMRRRLATTTSTTSPVSRSTNMEQPFFSKYNRFYPKRGHFCCKACGNPLYSHQTKLRRESDGWPAFGGCIDGAIGMTTAEERKRQEERERVAAVKIQAFYRGGRERQKVSEQIGLLIEKVKEFQEQQQQIMEDNDDDDVYEDELKGEEEQEEEEEEPGAIIIKKSTHHSNRRPQKPMPLFQNLSLHSLSDFSFDSNSLNSSSSSFASFGEDDDDENDENVNKSTNRKRNSSEDDIEMHRPALSPEKTKTSLHESNSNVANSAASAALKRTQDIDNQKSDPSPFNELLVEIHCHRCKSYLGNVYEESNRGHDGVTQYPERHQVNGRALKYVETDLPSRTGTTASLLFASTSQARLLGLKAATKKHIFEQKEEPEFIKARKQVRALPFVSPRSKKKKAAAGLISNQNQNKPGVGVTFQSPQRSPRKRLTSKQKKLENFFLSRSVH